MSKTDVRRDFQELQSVYRNLERIVFPALPRPSAARNEATTRDLVDWAAKLYCFSLLAHFRELLRSLLLLTESKHIPAAFVISRNLFEMSAQSYYVHKHVLQRVKENDLRAARDFLSEINTGSRYMREEYGEEIGQAFPAPRDIAKAVRSFNEFIEPGWATTSYSFLSEFSHPNMAAFMHYYEWEESASDNTNVKFVAPSPKQLVLALPNPSPKNPQCASASKLPCSNLLAAAHHSATLRSRITRHREINRPTKCSVRNPIAWTRSAPPTRAGLDRATCGRGRTLARRAARARAHRVAAAPRIDRVWCDPVPHVAPAPLLSRDPAGVPTRSRADSIRTDS